MTNVYCPGCGKEMTAKTKIELNDDNSRRFTSRMVCKACGWEGPEAVSETSTEKAEENARKAAQGTALGFARRGWRSTSEILPLPFEKVLCLCVDGNTFMACYDDKKKTWITHEPDGTRYPENDVAYWIRIPGLPAQKAQDEIASWDWPEAEKRLHKQIADYAVCGAIGMTHIWEYLLPLKRRYEKGERSRRLFNAMMEAE